jgi:hypothetical protein
VGADNLDKNVQNPLTAVVKPMDTPSVEGYLRSHGFVTGLLFTLFALNVPIHYLIVTFPMMYVWLASVLAHHRKLWLIVVVSQLVLSVAFLVLIHTTGGFADADYGLVYRLQVETTPSP